MMHVDAFLFYFRGFIVAALLIDPPAIGTVLAVVKSQFIPVSGTEQKRAGKENHKHHQRDDSSFGDKRSHVGTNPFPLNVSDYLACSWKNLIRIAVMAAIQARLPQENHFRSVWGGAS